MAESKKVEQAVEKAEAPEVVSKSDYDAVVKEYQRLAVAFNKAIEMIGNTYAEKVAKAIFEEIDKSAK